MIEQKINNFNLLAKVNSTIINNLSFDINFLYCDTYSFFMELPTETNCITIFPFINTGKCFYIIQNDYFEIFWKKNYIGNYQYYGISGLDHLYKIKIILKNDNVFYILNPS